MGTVTVIYGHAYDGKQEETFRQCLDLISRQAGNQSLYVVRSDVRVRQLRERITHDFGGSFHFPVVTLPELIYRWYRTFPDARRILSVLEHHLLVEEIFRQRLHESGERFCFYRFEADWGILEKVAEFLSSVRRVGIDSTQVLADHFQRCSPRRQPLYAELIEIFDRYTKRLKMARLIDEPGVVLEVARKAASGQLDIRAIVVTPTLFVVEGYYECTAPEQQIVTACFAQFERTFLTLDMPLNPYAFPAESDTPKPFRIFRKLVKYVRDSGCSVRATHALPVSTQDTARRAMADALFGLTPPEMTADVKSGINPADAHLLISAYPNKKEEVTGMARQIRQLVQNGKAVLRDIGITFPALEQYERLIAEIFPLFGIPFTMVPGYPLAASSVVITILRLFEVVLEDYSLDSLRKLCTSPFIQFRALETTDTPEFIFQAETVHELDVLARTFGVTGGKQQWLEKLTEYQRESTENQTVSAETTPSEQQPHLHSIAAMFALFETLAAFEDQQLCSVEEWRKRLQNIVARFQIPRRILQTPDRRMRETDTSALRAVYKLLDMLVSAYNTACPLKTFYEILRKAIQRETYFPVVNYADAVLIVGRLDTRQVEFRYLFMGGLVEKDLPGQDRPNIFLSDQEAQQLGLPTYQHRQQETDYLFYANLLNPRAHLYLSYPMQEGDTELLKSLYVDRIRRWQQPPQDRLLSEHEPAPENPSSSQTIEAVYTLTDVYQWLGAAVMDKKAERQHLEAALVCIQTTRGTPFTLNFLQGLHAQRCRNSGQLGCFDGILASEWARHAVQQIYDRHIYAASEFDRYVRCPLCFFFQNVLRLIPVPEVERDLSPLEIGHLLHRVVSRFYAAPTPHDQAVTRTTNVDHAFFSRKRQPTEWVQEAQIRLKQIVQPELELYPFSGVFWSQFTEMLLSGLDRTMPPDAISPAQPGLFAAFIEHEAGDTDKVEPWFLNASFGMFVFSEDEARQTPDTPLVILSGTPVRISGRDDQERTVTVPLRGQIDRIDVEPETSHAPRCVVVYDYKTGGVPSAQDIRDGLAFQLPVYVMAAQELLGDAYQVVAAGYYQIKSPQEIGKKGFYGSKEFGQQGYFSGSPRTLYDTHAEFWQSIEEYKRRMIRVTQAITAGQFAPTRLGSNKAGCLYCDYQHICRVDHQRMKNAGQ